MRFLFALFALGLVSASAPALADAASETKVVSYFANESQYERLGPDYADRLTEGITFADVLAQITSEIPRGTAVAVAAKTETGFHVMVGSQGTDLPSLYFHKNTAGETSVYPLGSDGDTPGLILFGMATQSTHMLNFIAPARLLDADVPRDAVAALLAPAEKLLNDFANEQH